MLEERIASEITLQLSFANRFSDRTTFASASSCDTLNLPASAYFVRGKPGGQCSGYACAWSAIGSVHFRGVVGTVAAAVGQKHRHPTIVTVGKLALLQFAFALVILVDPAHKAGPRCI